VVLWQLQPENVPARLALDVGVQIETAPLLVARRRLMPVEYLTL